MSDGLSDALKGINLLSSNTVTIQDTWIPVPSVKLDENDSLVDKLLKVGAKFDDGKAMLALVPASLDEAVGEILTLGSRKYAPNNWKKGIAYTRIVSSLKRHLNEFYKGNLIDNESNKPHLWHVACNVAFLIEFESNPEKYKKFNDLHEQN